MPPFVTDIYDEKVYAGDYVRCVVSYYDSIRYHERRRVQAIVDGNIVLANSMSPIGTSKYHPRNFALAGRQSPHRDRNNLDQLKPQKETPKMSLHIALRTDSDTDSNVVARVNGCGVFAIMAETDLQVLKNRVSAHIQADPTERWAIMTATTIAETSAPPVRFRAL